MAIYHAARNQSERFRGFLELISRFEFDFRRCGNYFFLNDPKLWCSTFNHTQCGCTCACAVACLYPHNSLSNVVASVTIHDDIYIYIYIYKRCLQKNMKPLWKVKGFSNRTSWKVSDVQIVRFPWVLVAKDTSNHPVADFLRSVP